MQSIKLLNQRFRYSSILLRELVVTDFKLRYQSSFLGYLWSLLKPLFLFGILYIVFVKILKVDYGVPYSGIYLLLGVVVWSFFAELTSTSVTSIIGKGDLLRKLNFPRYVLVLSVSFSAFINFLLNFVIVGLFMFLAQVPISFKIMFVPLLIVELYLLALGIAFILSTLFVKLRDVNYVWEVSLQILFYATPILFPITAAPIWLQKVLILNPLAQIIQDLRYVMISTKTITISSVYPDSFFIRLVPISIVLIILTSGSLYFRRRSKFFAEEI